MPKNDLLLVSDNKLGQIITVCTNLFFWSKTAWDITRIIIELRELRKEAIKHGWDWMKHAER